MPESDNQPKSRQKDLAKCQINTMKPYTVNIPLAYNIGKQMEY